MYLENSLKSDAVPYQRAKSGGRLPVSGDGDLSD